MQYVATGQQPTCRAPKEPQELRYRSENASTKYRVKRVLFLSLARSRLLLMEWRYIGKKRPRHRSQGFHWLLCLRNLKIRRSLGIIGRCRLVVTPLASKLITVGSALACFEMKLISGDPVCRSAAVFYWKEEIRLFRRGWRHRILGGSPRRPLISPQVRSRSRWRVCRRTGPLFKGRKPKGNKIALFGLDFCCERSVAVAA
jgi:hypothetical protein